jgi:type VI secretion system secreted protein VgrG
MALHDRAAGAVLGAFAPLPLIAGHAQLHAGQDLSVTAQGDLHHAAGHTYAQLSGQGASLYTHQGGIVAHAAHGPVSVRAHTDALQLLAQQGITVSSVNDEIRLYAKDRITLGGGDSSIVLDGPDITFTTPGTYTQHGGSHAFLPGASAAAELVALPQGLAVEAPREIEISRHYDDLSPMSAASYRVRFDDGTVLTGQLDAQGQKLLSGVPPGGYTVEFGEDRAGLLLPPAADNAEFMKPDVQAAGREAIERLLRQQGAKEGTGA